MRNLKVSGFQDSEVMVRIVILAPARCRRALKLAGLVDRRKFFLLRRLAKFVGVGRFVSFGVVDVSSLSLRDCYGRDGRYVGIRH